MGYRDAVALQAGVDESMLALVDDHEHSALSAKQKAALRFADAYLLGPSTVDDDLRHELSLHFTPEELGALLVRLMHYSSDKVMVALALDLEEPVRQVV
jgi:alkylhydroperoxidase family enzyme